MIPDIVYGIRRIADEKGLKHKAIAEKAGFPPNQLSAMLNGRKTIHPDFIPRIAKALGVTPNDLYGIHTDSA